MGIKNSKSEWVVFVDGDDWVEYKHIELLVKEHRIIGRYCCNPNETNR